MPDEQILMNALAHALGQRVDPASVRYAEVTDDTTTDGTPCLRGIIELDRELAGQLARSLSTGPDDLLLELDTSVLQQDPAGETAWAEFVVRAGC